MGVAAVVGELEIGCGRARTEYLRCRLEQRAGLRAAVRRLPNGLAVDPDGDVVEEEAAVHLRHVDPSFNAVGKCVERPDQIAAIDTEVEREVVTGAGGDADERHPVRTGSCGGDGERPVASGDPERVGAARHSLVGKRREVVVRAQNDHLDRTLARPLGEAGARRLAATGPRVDEQYGPPRPIRSVPAGMRHPEPILPEWG